MKKYINPKAELIVYATADIISTSSLSKITSEKSGDDMTGSFGDLTITIG